MSLSTARRRPVSRRRARILTAGAVALLGLIAAILLAQRSAPLRAPVARAMTPPPPRDPFPYEAARSAQYVDRAVAGEAHVLFTASPGGVLATAARVSALRPAIDSAAKGTGIDPNVLEGLVFVESAGRPNVVAGGDPAGAAGLTQILPSTAQSMLGLHVDLARSRALTRAIAAAEARGAAPPAIAHLQRRRAAADQRFDPTRALAATVRYLEIARAQLARDDLAVVSYHMGIGNVHRVLDAYDGGRPVPYVQLFFDTAPDRNSSAFALLSSFSDQSWLYYWRVLGAVAIMHLYRSDRPALERLNRLQTASDSAAQVLHPPDRTPTFADPAALASAYRSGTLRALPSNASQLGLAYASTIGSLAHSVKAPPGLYRGLRPVALALLLELAGRVRALAHGAAPLQVTSAVSDERYQNELGTADPPAAAGYSFTIARHYVSGAQAGAFQAMLDRLQALNLIAWTAYPSEIEITVASDAARVIAHGV
jgi:hypothetical protein